MLKTLLKQVKQYKTASLLTPVFIMLEVVLDVLIPFVTAKLIDYGISAGHMPSVYKYGAIMLVMAFLSMIAAIMAENMPLMLHRALPATCVTPCTRTFSGSPSATSTSTALRASSPA